MMSRKEEKEWTTAGRHLFLTAFPNPGRIGCPGAETLRILALDALKLALPEREMWLDHMTCCSPCFHEYYSISEKTRLQKRLIVLALCAILVLAVGLGAWLATQRKSSVSPGSNVAGRDIPRPAIPKDQQNSQGRLPIQQVAALLDLRNMGTTRGPGESAGKKDLLILPKGILDLSVQLPIGSEEGNYELQVQKSKIIVLETKGHAMIKDHIAVLAVKLDTSTLAPGKYVLKIRQLGPVWEEYSIQIK
jgi:hypothetical protein